MPVISDDAFMHLKTFARIGTAVARFPPGSGDQPDRLRVPIKGTYVSMVLDLLEREGEPLDDAQAICEATLAGDTLVATTTIRHGRYEAVVEYPVKTMNANEREWVYQTDTGPVLWPDLDVPPEQLHERLDVAFEAHNDPGLGAVHRPSTHAHRGRRRRLPLLRFGPGRRRREHDLPHPPRRTDDHAARGPHRLTSSEATGGEPTRGMRDGPSRPGRAGAMTGADVLARVLKARRRGAGLLLPAERARWRRSPRTASG